MKKSSDEILPAGAAFDVLSTYFAAQKGSQVPPERRSARPFRDAESRLQETDIPQKIGKLADLNRPRERFGMLKRAVA